MIIDELNELDEKYGVGSVVIHDSMFFQNPKWLQEWIKEYPRRANKVWPYWAAGEPTLCGNGLSSSKRWCVRPIGT